MAELKRLNLAEALSLHAEGRLQGVFAMSEEDYRACPGMNQSSLKFMQKCPAAYRSYMEYQKVQSKRSKALDLGVLVHILLLEGQETFDAKVAQAPDCDYRSKQYKDFKEAHPDKIIVSEADLDIIYGIHKSAQTDLIVKNCFSGGKAEIVAFTNKNGLLLKGKIDYVKDDTIFDLKTTLHADEREFQMSAYKYRYDIQAAFYLDLINSAIGKDRFKNFVILAVEKSVPFLFNYFTIGNEDMMKAREEYEELLRLYTKCERENIWPGYEPRFKRLNFARFQK